MPTADDSPRLAPLLIWLLVPLAARWPPAGESLALQEMLVVQTIVAGLLFPALLRDVRSLVAAAVTALPFVQFSAFLSLTSTARAAPAAAVLMLWLAALWAWRSVLKTSRTQTYGVAVANALTIGGAI